MKRGEIWWVNFNPSVGGEPQKVRPAVIVSNDASNANINRVQVVPLTSRTERVYACEALVTAGGQKSKALASQVTTAAKERLTKKLGKLSAADMRQVEQAVMVQLGLG